MCCSNKKIQNGNLRDFRFPGHVYILMWLFVFSGSTGQTPNPQQTGNPMGSMFQTPAMQSLMQQMSANPDMFQNMMQSPYMQDMMTQMVQNPELMASVSSVTNFFLFDHKAVTTVNWII